MKNIRLINRDKKTIIIILLIPIMFISQYYLFKFGILQPQIKGIEISAVEGKYIKDIDKYVIKLNKGVIFSAGDYVKFPSYAKDPVVEFKSLDEDNKVKIEDNSDNIENTVKITGKKEGLTSVAIVRNNKILKRFNILVVNPTVVNLNTEIEGDLTYVGDIAKIKDYVEVDFDRFNEKYKVNYKSSNENVLKIEDNKIYAVGVGNAIITASIDSKEQTFKYNISAKLKSISANNISVEVGESTNIQASVTTTPKNLQTPKIKYAFAENKLPVQRKIRLDSNGQILGLRQGVEKLLVYCGTGKNKVEKYIYVTVNETSIEDKAVEGFYLNYYFMEDDLILNLEWNEMNNAEIYEIYIKDNKKENSDYELIKTLDKNSITKKDGKINETIKIESKKSQEFDYDIYVIARNQNQISQKSKIYKVENTLDSDEN
ncbi:hypothetical protein [Intestinibacter bartlettii]|uniref:Bacterial Ig-like domain (Group 2) n=1 Tax=Intestinibacter bartlettii TaxID=261299 RepID=A0ABS6DXR9_9FIRM|nr:hypothetical protein [Intestinibacter bartlettii]MBU5336643.1 hypothetical protein [Intestinibacter bartlettii]MDO5011640.1 hypothetical protein [Intestinibacter bartlettii]